MENLSLLCRNCHVWHHNQTDTAEAPVEITEEDKTKLLP
ncbi:nitrate/TMAO reductase-like tetraheme cytochrome c subunit [Halolamina salifodinae]|uniref:Nitrate/TMAO reductase-like tetraheme cytochrome c subunit n=2 Tax=Halolamina salifodinae TaxID=1202767 RepID=A0A8T4GYG5_9EURY|nr:nitrate/TMAO reductase-like tetraheme cytochrome c subunit [Halolamina salifodinae]